MWSEVRLSKALQTSACTARVSRVACMRGRLCKGQSHIISIMSSNSLLCPAGRPAHSYIITASVCSTLIHDGTEQISPCWPPRWC